MDIFLDILKEEVILKAGPLGYIIGWYHSHPGYGCWLSGINVERQLVYQRYMDPYLAVVIDPTRTDPAGKVDIGAFRKTLYKHPHEPISEYRIPSDKIEDFHAHFKKYYSLDITYFKSSLNAHLLDQLWNEHWVNVLSSSPLLGNGDSVAGQISDLAGRLEQAETQVAHSRFEPLIAPPQRKEEGNSSADKTNGTTSKKRKRSRKKQSQAAESSGP